MYTYLKMSLGILQEEIIADLRNVTLPALLVFQRTGMSFSEAPCVDTRSLLRFHTSKPSAAGGVDIESPRECEISILQDWQGLNCCDGIKLGYQTR